MATTTGPPGRAEANRALDATSLGRLAFDRALQDSGLRRQDIDGLCASLPYGGAEPTPSRPRWVWRRVMSWGEAA